MNAWVAYLVAYFTKGTFSLDFEPEKLFSSCTSLRILYYVYTRANCYGFMSQVTKNRNYHG